MPEVAVTRQPPTLPGIEELIRASWSEFQARFPLLIGLYLLTIVAFAVPTVLGALLGAVLAGVGGRTASIALIALGFVGGIGCGFWCLAALFQAVAHGELGLRESLERGRDLIPSLIWVSLLAGFVVLGGYCLLILPGILFTVWFFSSQFILVTEDVRGVEALLKSREYVRGFGVEVALRLLLVWFASLVVGAVPFIGLFLSLAFFPFLLLYHYLLFQDLRLIKGELLYSCGTADRLKWPGVALAGYLIMALSLFFAFKALLPLDVWKFRNNPRNGGTLPVLTLPPQDRVPPAGSGGTPGGSAVPAETVPAPSAGSESDGYPENVHVFIYAVNYTGKVRANGTVIRELEGKPDMQYSYNQDGRGLRYGRNEIRIDFSRLPDPPSSLLEIHVRISRAKPGGGKEILGEWRVQDGGSGTKDFEFDIPR